MFNIIILILFLLVFFYFRLNKNKKYNQIPKNLNEKSNEKQILQQYLCLTTNTKIQDNKLQKQNEQFKNLILEYTNI